MPADASFCRLTPGRKLVAMNMITTAGALIIACAALLAFDVSSARARIVRDVETLGDVVGSNSTAALAFGDATAAHETLRALAAQPHIVSAALMTRDGVELARYDRVGSPRGALSVSRPIAFKHETIGTVIIESDLTELTARTSQFVRTAAIVITATFGLAVLLAYLLQRVISGPVLRLTAIMREVT